MADRGRRGGKKIDSVHWTTAQGFSLSVAAGSVVGILIGAALHLPETLLRIRGEFCCWANGVQTPPLSTLVTAGLIAVPANTGTTVLWRPFTDGDAPWIWIDSYTLVYQEMVTDVIDVQLAGVRRVVDSKAMRILRNQEVQLVVENTALETGINIDFSFAGRILAGS